MSGKYDDIINLPHHVSTKHPHMSLHQRAAQFAPFAALVGHGEAVDKMALEHIELWNRTSGEGIERTDWDEEDYI